MADGDFKDLPRRTTSDKVLRDKAFNVAKNPKYDGYQLGIASLVYKFLIKSRANKFAGSGVKSEIMPYQELAKEIHKTIIKQFENQKV